jgi:hypothetical protein
MIGDMDNTVRTLEVGNNDRRFSPFGIGKNHFIACEGSFKFLSVDGLQ